MTTVIWEDLMIARIWHGIASIDKADEFSEYINETGVRDIKAATGNRSVYVLRRLDGTQAHFMMISLWDSREAIAKFAGPDIDKARYHPRDEEFLLELEPTVKHYQVLVQP
jgi:heme-degrading monooxygenase HmoA